MSEKPAAGPTPEQILDYITGTYPETVVANAMNAWFFSLDEKHWPNFATIVTTDEHDGEPVSNLSRPGAYRLNIGVGRQTFARLVRDAHPPDYAALDVVQPHPVYAAQRWISILNPSVTTFEKVVKPLLAEAHDRLAAQRQRAAAGREKATQL